MHGQRDGRFAAPATKQSSPDPPHSTTCSALPASNQHDTIDSGATCAGQGSRRLAWLGWCPVRCDRRMENQHAFDRSRRVSPRLAPSLVAVFRQRRRVRKWNSHGTASYPSC